MNGHQMQFMAPAMTPVVKKLMIINVVIWALGVLIIQNFFFSEPILFKWFGFIPNNLVHTFFIWQPFTYMFLHSPNIFHILFNMLLLWWFGGELEGRWGSRFFLTYYMVSGVGAALIYLFGILGFAVITGDYMKLSIPVVGASGAVFGVLTAYGILYGERIGYFFFVFPMKMKYMVMILIGIELASLLGSRMGGQVANLAHLGGVVSGFLFLTFYTRFKGRRTRSRTRRHGRRLKLVVDNEREEDEKDGPRYWN